ncbi:MAG: V-type ATP synthase subunit A, partial [Thermoplasmata archaeon]|nr:V-type ATP synthase subunit A [Thermoplasmata archaeon]
MEGTGEVHRVSGPVVTATGITPKMYDVVFVGDEGLMGEVIELHGGKSVIQVYEDTSGVRPGEKVVDTAAPLVAELGPGLIRSIYDGIQRPLPVLAERAGDYISRGLTAPGLDRSKSWEFQPTVKAGDKLVPGSIIGTVEESESITHRVMLPPTVGGEIQELRGGSYQVEDTIGTLTDGTKVQLMHKWPVRISRPYQEKLM